VTGNTLTATGTGAVTVEATVPAGGDYAAALPVDRSFDVTADFASWQQAMFTAAELANPAVSGPSAVCGHDGLPNLVKYALGLSPKQNVTSGLPTVSTNAGNWIYSYSRPSGLTDISYTVETSRDLASWTPVDAGSLSVSSSGGEDSCTATYPATGGASVFFHLRISQ
jgi:hypothetical protein